MTKAKHKAADKWIETYKTKLPGFGRSTVLDQETHFKKVLQRIYEILKNYVRKFDLEKLLDRYKIESSGLKNTTELGFLLEELKAQV